ncbi:MAG TPA: hypothetical protein VIJ71_00295 [Mycobacteriales bacterium]
MTTVRALADDLHTLTLDADPLAASFFGEPGYEGRLPDLSRDASARLVTTLRTVLDRADALTAADAAEGVTSPRSGTARSAASRGRRSPSSSAHRVRTATGRPRW